MISAFLVQYAAGCYWAVAATAIKLTDWRYVRLMCIVSCAIALLAQSFQMSEIKNVRLAATHPAVLMLATGILCGFVWLFVNASQGERIRNSQRFIAFAAGTACFAATLWLPLSSGPTQASPSITNTVSAIPVSRQARAAPDPFRLIGSTLLGAGLLGVATTAMLLGHRYLTDTGMAITPLKKITHLYLALLAARIIWNAAVLTPMWLNSEWPPTTELYFWLALLVRLGVGLVVAGAFGYMIWDCVRRRATQSATALYYLSMLFIFFGELSAQYLLQAEGLPL